MKGDLPVENVTRGRSGVIRCGDSVITMRHLPSHPPSHSFSRSKPAGSQTRRSTVGGAVINNTRYRPDRYRQMRGNTLSGNRPYSLRPTENILKYCNALLINKFAENRISSGPDAPVRLLPVFLRKREVRRFPDKIRVVENNSVTLISR